jgi:hypothetical protein
MLDEIFYEENSLKVFFVSILYHNSKNTKLKKEFWDFAESFPIHNKSFLWGDFKNYLNIIWNNPRFERFTGGW